MLQLSDLHRHGGLGGEESGGSGFSPLPLFTDRSAAPAREEMEGGFKSPNSAVRIVVLGSVILSFLLISHHVVDLSLTF